MVFAGLYPVDADQYAELRDALEKLRLNDSSFFYEPETSAALGFGFRCGFLGLLHMEIVQERLEREFDLELLVTAPSVRYRVLKTDGEVVEMDSPARLPEPGKIEAIEEPVITATILTGDEFVGPILKLCQDKRGIQKGIHYITTTRVMIQYELPLAEILLDFYDKLKSVSQGYASLDYEFTGHWVSPLVKLDVLVNGDPVDALSLIVHQETAYPRGKSLVEKMRKMIPRQMFEVAIQAAIGSRVIARETVKPLRKNVHRQVLRRRHHPQEEAPREAEGRQEADEAGGHRRHPAGGLPRGAARRRVESPVEVAMGLSRRHSQAARRRAGGAGRQASAPSPRSIMKNPQIVSAAISMLNPKDTSVGGGGGLGDVIGAFNKGGTRRTSCRPGWGAAPTSRWTRAPSPASSAPTILGQFAQKAGIGQADAGSALASVLPELINHITPAGPGAPGQRPRRRAGLAPRPARRALATGAGRSGRPGGPASRAGIG